MRYSELDLESLKQYPKVLVTGPQRSGTTIGARVLAHDLGHAYVDEDDVGIRSLSRLTQSLLADGRLVIQGPCFCSLVHWLDLPGTLVVLMRRDTDDIRASQQRIAWAWEQHELSYYFRSDGEIAVVRYEAWDNYQKARMQVPYLELEYESLSGHPLWVEKARRADFGTRQYRPKS